jgi:hypothetical protein
MKTRYFLRVLKRRNYTDDMRNNKYECNEVIIDFENNRYLMLNYCFGLRIQRFLQKFSFWILNSERWIRYYLLIFTRKKLFTYKTKYKSNS